MIRDDVLTAFDALPTGTFTGEADGRRYVVTRQDFADGRSHKLVAEELGGTDYISLNLYRLASGARLKPCEMPERKVVAFLLALRPLLAPIRNHLRIVGTGKMLRGSCV